MKLKLVTIMFLMLCCRCIAAQDKPSMQDVDRVRLAEAFRLSKTVGDRVWKGWSKVPFAVMLVTPDYEFLMRHPKPSPDFEQIGYDKLLESTVYFRKRKFSTHLLATAPFIQGSSFPVIVVGEAENTESATSTPWIITLFHEHFHQLQDTQPTYFARIKDLNLAGGDETGMWMLNYAFPYNKKEVQQQFSVMSKLLAEAVDARNKEDRAIKLTAYLQARKEFQQMVGPDEYKYLSFQFWQEGIARYTEYRVAELAAAKYKPTKKFRALKDYVPFAQVAEEMRETIIKQLLTEKLGESKRLVVYPFGAAEGLLLDNVSPGWQNRYFVDMFDLNKYYKDLTPADAAVNTKGAR